METKCQSCKWWKSLHGDESNPDACLFCFLNDHSRRRDETGYLEYTKRRKKREKAILPVVGAH